MSDLQVEKAHLSDLESIWELDRLVLGNDSRALSLQQAVENGHCYVARQGERTVGFAICAASFFGNEFLELLIVHPELRRQGVASRLIQRVEADCQTDKLFTSTNESNVKMQQLCEKLGYVRSGWIENLDEGDPEIVYFKRLRF